MMKIGMFTFGGGYAMINLLDNEFVERKKWLGSEEFMNLVTIAESTPGPIAINCSTYIGYKKAGFLGALFSTIGMCVPSFVIIYLISLFFEQFLAVSAIASAFKGIQVCVIFLILSAGLKMLKKIKKTVFNVTVILITFTAMTLFSLFSVSFSSIFYILIFGLISILIYTVGFLRSREDKK
ncbi:MAG: chromate transporter [Clostridia bacterium]|nr:chromate transporter [Clostridia bacterium]